MTRTTAMDEMTKALEAMVDLYCDLANSGDAGFWDPEKVDEVKQARAALAAQPAAPVGKPVAWRYRHNSFAEGDWILGSRKPAGTWDEIQPLYATPSTNPEEQE